MDDSETDCHPNPSDPYRVIDTDEGWIVAYWAEKLGLSRERLVELVAEVGCEVDQVRKALAQRGG
jgi:hypothetical protein